MTDFVRVSLPDSKSEASVSAEFAEALGLTVLDAPAARSGRALAPARAGGRPIKPRTTVAAKKAAARSRRPKPTSAAGGEKSGVAAKPEGESA